MVHPRRNLFSRPAELVNAQGKRPLAAFWETGQRHHQMDRISELAARADTQGRLILKYGQEPGRQFYTHISDQYSPFYTCITQSGQDSTHVLDGLLYHESDRKSGSITPIPLVSPIMSLP